MTLYQLIAEAKNVGNNFNSWDIPLKYEGQDIEVSFQEEGDNKRGYVINIKINKNDLD